VQGERKIISTTFLEYTFCSRFVQVPPPIVQVSTSTAGRLIVPHADLPDLEANQQEERPRKRCERLEHDRRAEGSILARGAISAGRLGGCLTRPKSPSAESSAFRAARYFSGIRVCERFVPGMAVTVARRSREQHRIQVQLFSTITRAPECALCSPRRIPK
jgi:hypothetical protein